MKKKNIKHINIQYISDNINLLSMKDKKIIFNLIAMDMGEDAWQESKDGCRIVIEDINDLHDDTINAIIQIISIVVEDK